MVDSLGVGAAVEVFSSLMVKKVSFGLPWSLLSSTFCLGAFYLLLSAFYLLPSAFCLS